MARVSKKKTSEKAEETIKDTKISSEKEKSLKEKSKTDAENLEEIYNYIKYVDEKAIQSDKTMKFLVAQQSEQMKELIQSKSNNLSRFFEEAIRLQIETIRNTYESIIAELKNNFELELKNRDVENQKMLNQKVEALKTVYEEKNTLFQETQESNYSKKVSELTESFEKSKQIEVQNKADEVYQNTIRECQFEKEKEINDLKVYYENKIADENSKIKEEIESTFAVKIQEKADEVYRNTIVECTAEKQKEIDELKSFYEQKIQEKSDEVYLSAKEEFAQKYEQTKQEIEALLNKEAELESLKIQMQKEHEEEIEKLQCENREAQEEIKSECEAEKEKIVEEYEERITEINNWNLRNLREKLEECKAESAKELKSDFEEEKKKIQNEVYKETRAKCEEEKRFEIKQIEDELKNKYTSSTKEKLEIQARYFEEKIQEEKHIQEEIAENRVNSAYNTGREDERKISESEIATLKASHENDIVLLKEYYDSEFEKMKAFYESEIKRMTQESYDKGKGDGEGWTKIEMKKQLKTQADFYESEIEQAKADTKAEMYAEMDEAARRNEEELKLFLDFYEAKMKPFKKLINIHATTNEKIKEIQNRLKNALDKAKKEEGGKN